MTYHIVDMWRKDRMQFVEDVEVGGICLFILIAYHEVHLLQLVVELNAFHCDMAALTLPQDIVNQCQFPGLRQRSTSAGFSLTYLSYIFTIWALLGLPVKRMPIIPRPSLRFWMISTFRTWENGIPK